MAASNDSTTEQTSDQNRPSGAGLGDRGEPEPKIKVTDRRMFTPDGRLRDEYSHLADAPPPEAGATSTPRAEPPPPAAAAPPRPEPPRPPGGAGPAPAPGAAPGPAATPFAGRPSPADVEPPDLSHPGAPGFFDLVAMLAESAAVYLGDAGLPDGSSSEDLELARLHIDLLDVLRKKTAGNLTQQESAALDDVLYRLRVRYVQKRG